jgi:hypothetical protein
MLRNAALRVGATLHYLIGARRVSPPLVIGGLLATGGVVALAYLVGADPRLLLATTQPGAVPSLLNTLAGKESGA